MISYKNNKKAFEMSFNWIFALVVGGIILFIAVYAAIKIGYTGNDIGNTEAAAKIVSLLDPMGAGIASGTSDIIKFQSPSRVFIKCDSKNNKPFGKEEISFSGKTFGKYSKEGNSIVVRDKYLFGKNLTEGKEIPFVSFPFNMPFKIGDLIIFLNENYCFYKAPDEIKSNLEDQYALRNFINFTNNTLSCKGKIVCFDSNVQGCDIKVTSSCLDTKCDNIYETGQVSKDGKNVYYAGNLIYAAIFSDTDIYECNIIRLKGRADGLYGIYLDKMELIIKNGCSSVTNLDSLRGTINSSRELSNYYLQSKYADESNQAARIGCKLYQN
jgi:hypothetical protein